ncbi:MAG: DMT family transporter [Sphingobacteriaceae bacterium]
MNFELKGELFALTTAICWTFGMLYFTEAAKRLGANVLNHFRLVLAALFLALAVILFDHIGLADLFSLPKLSSWLWLGLSGFIGLTIGDWCAFSAFEILGPRKTSLFYTFAPGAALVFGILFLNETISLVAFSGMIITIAGVFWVIFNRKSQEEHTHHEPHYKGVLFAIGGSLTQGIGLVFSKIGLQQQEGVLSPLHASWIRLTIAALTLFIISIFRNKALGILRSISKADGPAIRYTLIATIISPVIGVSLSLYSANLINVSIAQTLFSMVPVFILPVSWLLYREKITFQAFWGALIAVSGVLVLVWRNEISTWF